MEESSCSDEITSDKENEAEKSTKRKRKAKKDVDFTTQGSTTDEDIEDPPSFKKQKTSSQIKGKGPARRKPQIVSNGSVNPRVPLSTKTTRSPDPKVGQSVSPPVIDSEKSTASTSRLLPLATDETSSFPITASEAAVMNSLLDHDDEYISTLGKRNYYYFFFR